MDPILVVSAHMDDAVLSAGQFLVGWPEAHVLTIFGGLPSEERVTIYDVNSGFKDSTDALVARAHEDDRAMEIMRATQLRAPFVDNQYRRLDPMTISDEALTDDVCDTISNTVKTISATRLIGPVGLAHPDHLIVGDAVVRAARACDVPTWLYEDIPTRVQNPELVPDRLAAVVEQGWNVTLDFIGTGSRDTKEQALQCYESQLWALDPYMMYVPERFWRLSPNG